MSCSDENSWSKIFSNWTRALDCFVEVSLLEKILLCAQGFIWGFKRRSGFWKNIPHDSRFLMTSPTCHGNQPGCCFILMNSFVENVSRAKQNSQEIGSHWAIENWWTWATGKILRLVNLNTTYKGWNMMKYYFCYNQSQFFGSIGTPVTSNHIFLGGQCHRLALTYLENCPKRRVFFPAKSRHESPGGHACEEASAGWEGRPPGVSTWTKFKETAKDTTHKHLHTCIFTSYTVHVQFIYAYYS